MILVVYTFSDKVSCVIKELQRIQAKTNKTVSSLILSETTITNNIQKD